MSLRILFAGTPHFAEYSLNALISAGFQVVAVYTQPDRPSGRGQKITASPVKQLAEKKQIPVYQPVSLRDASEEQTLRELHVDLMIVVAYGLILPRNILTIPRLGCLNVHASLLPRWRGAAPIQHAILAGDHETGVTIMQMEAGLDTGPMLARSICSITPDETSASLHDKLATQGAELLIKTIENLNFCIPEKQNDALATYAHKISRQDAEMDWSLDVMTIERKIRAFYPTPIAFTRRNSQFVRIWSAEIVSLEKQNASPGVILQANSNGIDVATGQGILRLKMIQLSGGRALSVRDVLNARQNDFLPGVVLGICTK